MDTRYEKFCLIIPCYKVGPFIQDVIRGLPRWICRVILVDDASPDLNAQFVKGIDEERIAVVSHVVNRGVGGAMLTGYRLATDLGAPRGGVDVCQ